MQGSLYYQEQSTSDSLFKGNTGLKRDSLREKQPGPGHLQSLSYLKLN